MLATTNNPIYKIDGANERNNKMAKYDKLKTINTKVETYEKLIEAKEEYARKHNINMSITNFTTYLLETALKTL